MTNHLHKFNHQHNRNFLIKYLISVAEADNNFSSAEKKLLHKKAMSLGINEEEITHIKDNPALIHFHPPKDKEERFENLYCLVEMMLADGEILIPERNICKNYGLTIGYTSDKVDIIINKIIEGINGKISLEETFDEIFKKK